MQPVFSASTQSRGGARGPGRSACIAVLVALCAMAPQAAAQAAARATGDETAAATNPTLPSTTTVSELRSLVDQFAPQVDAFENATELPDSEGIANMRSLATQLREGIRAVQNETDSGGEATRVIRRARKLIKRLMALDLAVWLSTSAPDLEALEQSERTPSPEHLAVLDEGIYELRAAIDEIAWDTEVDGNEPRALRRARELLPRGLAQTLRPAIAELRPLVEQAEAADRISEEQWDALIAIGQPLLERSKAVLAETKTGKLQAAPQPVKEAADLLFRTAALRLNEWSDHLEPIVADLELRATAPSNDEVTRLRTAADELREGMLNMGFNLEPGKDILRGPALDRARLLLDRVAALELAMWAERLRPQLERLESQDSLSDAELAQLKKDADELARRTEELRERSGTGFVKARPEGTLQAEEMVARSESLAATARAEDQLPAIERAVEQDSPTSESQIEALQPALDDLRQKVEVAEQASDATRSPSSLAGLERARSLLIRMEALEVNAEARRLRPGLEALETRGIAPLPAETEALRPQADRLRAALKHYDDDKDDTAEDPSTVVAARELWGRYVRLDLAASVDAWTPYVDRLEQVEEAPSREEVVRLRAITNELRPKVQAAGGDINPFKSEGKIPAEVLAARKLLDRAVAMLPENAVAPEEAGHEPETQPVERFWRLYGSLRLRLLTGPDRSTEIDDKTGRVGVRVEHAFKQRFVVYARGEFGMNVLENSEFFVGDPGAADPEDDTAFPLRLIFAGIEYGKRSLSFGKQWSTYRDVGVFTDQFPYLASDGTGMYAAGTDGGVSGTGRADNALQFRSSRGDFKYGVQVQIRDKTVNNQSFADTIGGSVVYTFHKDFDLGFAFSDVRDGIPDPEVGEPKEGDRIGMLGFRYRSKAGLYSAVTVTRFEQHEIDDLDRYYDGNGVEIYLQYDPIERLRFMAGYSLLDPRHHPGEYEVQSLSFGVRYDLGEKWKPWLIVKVDDSTNSDGSARNQDTLALAMHYNF